MAMRIEVGMLTQLNLRTAKAMDVTIAPSLMNHALGDLRIL